MFRTANEVIQALRDRKEALGLSNATVDELAGLTEGHTDKALGPSRIRLPNLYTFMSIIGALGYAVQFVDDPERKLEHRWTKRRENLVLDNGRISKEAMSRIRRRAVNARWARLTPDQRAAIARYLNKHKWAKK